MVTKILTHTLGRVSEQALISLMLLSIAVIGLVFTLADLIRGLNLLGLLPITLFAMLLGWGLAGFRPVPGWLAGGVLAILGLEAVLWQVSNLETMLLDLAGGGADLLWQTWRWPTTGIAPNITLFSEPLAALGIGLSTLFTRQTTWLTALATGSPVFDPVAAALVWSLVLWGVSAWAGWSLRRTYKPLPALLPIGVLQATLLAYHPSKATNLIPLVIAALLLLGLFSYLSMERQWQINHIDVTPTLKTELVLAVVPIAAVLVILAGITPSVSIWKIADQIQAAFEPEKVDPVAESLGLEKGPAPAEVPLEIFSSRLKSPGLPRDHLLGSGPELSEKVALIISTGSDPVSPDAAPVAPAPPRHYWRGLTYDRYSGRGWHTGKTSVRAYSPGDRLVEKDNLPLLTQTVQVLSNQGGLLYTSGTLLTAEQPFKVSWRDTGDSFAATTGTAVYQATSVVSSRLKADALRNAGTNYPPAIARRYLSLPDDTPERVLALGRELTATAPTPYDRAKAIEAYVRQFPYSLDLPTPPPGRDMVDYFLFDLQTGYCDYYATAMVVLARAGGLPARLAVGYASGSYDPVNAQYIVTEAQAHSWAEIYFPEYGWVEFEPTAAQPVSDRTGSLSATNLPEVEPSSQPNAILTRLNNATLWWLVPLSVLLLTVITGSGWWLVDQVKLRRGSPTAAIALLFERLQGHSKRLGAVPVPGNTPYETARNLVQNINQLRPKKRWQKLFTPTAQEIHQLTQLYVQTAYSDQRPTVGQQAEAINIWRHLRWRLWLLRLVQWFGKL